MSQAPLTTEKRPYTWILYDGRAEFGDTDDAAVLEAFSSRRDLKSNLFRTWRGHDGVLFEYDVVEGNKLVNERKIGHLREGKALIAKCAKQKKQPRERESPSFSPNFDERNDIQ